MKQAVMVTPGEVVYREVEVPVVNAGEIKVKMKRIGVCGSDIHVAHGKHPYTSYPVVQGHEVSGEVVEIGAGVTNVKVGDKVTIQPQIVCGKCYPCTHGMYNACESLRVMGFQATGMYSDFFVVEAEKALALPNDMSFDDGAMIEPLAVAVHAIRRAVFPMDGKKVLVLGGGPIGNLVAQTAKAMGADSVLLSELSAFRLETAEKCEIKTVNPKEKDLLEAITETFGADKADIIFECVGVNETMEQAINYARKGTSIIVVGVFADFGRVNMGFVQDHELTLIGSAMYRVEDYVKAIELASTGAVKLGELITHRVNFSEYAKAYEIADTQKDLAMKIMVDMEA